jgi:HEAT repeat protein
MKSTRRIKAILSDIEAGEAMYAKLGEEDIPHLTQLMQKAEPWLAARCVYALSRIGGEEANATILSAAADERKEVRIAVANASKVLPDTVSNAVLDSLIDDTDLGVRKFAIKSISSTSDTRLIEKLHLLSQEATNETLKGIAADRLHLIEEGF